ncbi:hypothetical protein TI04_07135 [Achromatium sp. WMS2]|nr:hypothetical protein TI04_07135 [Achromatium sp. WMS2]
MLFFNRYAMVVWCLLLNVLCVHADEVRVAVAANFIAPARQIAESFEIVTGHKVVLSSGSTGKLYAQIKHGAPFAVFLSADSTTPQKLTLEGLADLNSRFTYAIGKLVLWSKIPGFVDNDGEVLRGSFGVLAIADPKLAPYGLAAQQVLVHMKLWNKVQPHLVMGESVGQTMQFVESGNADLGFVSLSQIIKDRIVSAGSWWQVPTEFYQPIYQDAIRLLNVPQNVATANAFLQYLQGPEATAIIQSYGYALPD